MRADAVHRLLARPRGAAALAAADIPALPELAAWDRHVLGVAIGDLVADGRLADDKHGRLVVRAVKAPAVALLRIAGRDGMFVADEVRIDGPLVHATGRWRRRQASGEAWSSPRSYTWCSTAVIEIRWGETAVRS